MMEEYEPEMGQALFGQPHQTYGCPGFLASALRHIAEMMDGDTPFENNGSRFKNDVFEVEAYSWNEDVEQPYNFKWKDIEVSWYKYLGRGMSVNKKVTKTEVKQMLTECLNSL